MVSDQLFVYSFPFATSCAGPVDSARRPLRTSSLQLNRDASTAPWCCWDVTDCRRLLTTFLLGAMDEMYVLHNWYGTIEAKRDFFLSTDDLRSLDYCSIGGGIGCGPPSKFYEPGELRRAAVLKHGEAGLQAKEAARAKREANKRKREEAANEAAEKLACIESHAEQAKNGYSSFHSHSQARAGVQRTCSHSLARKPARKHARSLLSLVAPTPSHGLAASRSVAVVPHSWDRDSFPGSSPS